MFLETLKCGYSGSSIEWEQDNHRLKGMCYPLQGPSKEVPFQESVIDSLANVAMTWFRL